MPANNLPIYSRGPKNGQGGAILGPSANTAQDGTGSNVTVVFTADATNGSYVEKIILKAAGSPAATVARVFLCTATGSFTPGTTNTAANSTLIAEKTLPAVTSSQVAASPDIEIPIGFAIEADHKLFIAFGTSTGSAGTGYGVTTIGGKY
jgi:hypothetical protein